MSNQHKMTYKGKKYVTKISVFGSCKDCAFSTIFLKNPLINHCTYEEPADERCFASFNKDGKSRIWVEDKTAQKKTKDHYWIVEYCKHSDKDWNVWGTYKTRKRARVISDTFMVNTLMAKSRIRKFVPVK